MCSDDRLFGHGGSDTCGQESALADERERLIGTWKLVEGINEDLATGEKTNVYKGVAVGIYYLWGGRTDHGHCR